MITIGQVAPVTPLVPSQARGEAEKPFIGPGTVAMLMGILVAGAVGYALGVTRGVESRVGKGKNGD